MRTFAAVLVAGWMLATLCRAGGAPVLAEAGEPVRSTDGRIDIPATIDVLRREGVNTYLYQVWRVATDWDQLPAFADAAADARIDVWVYLVPWSETPVKSANFAFPEPFKTDYIAWADAIGALSARHPGITGWVMDDFYVNATQPDRFTDEYVRRMLEAGKAQNPRLKFFPVVYFQQPWADFVTRFGSKIDGVIACYPRSQAEVDDALEYLNGEPYGPSLLVTFSRGRKVKAHTRAIASCSVRADWSAGARFRCYFDDQSMPTERGRHVAFVLINGRLAWERQVGTGDLDCDVDIPLDEFVARGQRVTIEVGVEVSDLETGAFAQARLDDLRIVDASGRRIRTHWELGKAPVIDAELTPPSSGGRGAIPMYLLLATLPEEHQKRYQEPPTVENIRKKVHFAIDNLRAGKTAGVICWYTPKDSDSPILPMIREEFADISGR